MENLALIGRILAGLGGIAILVIGIGNFICSLQEYRERIQWRTRGPHYNRNVFIARTIFSLVIIAASISFIVFATILSQV